MNASADELYDDEGRRLVAAVGAWVRDPRWALDGATPDALAVAIDAWQRARNPVLARVARAWRGDRPVRTIDDIAAVPTDVFKAARVACFAPRLDRRVFWTSGTTRDVRGQHPFADLSLYDAAARAIASRWLLPRPAYRCVLLAEPERDAPHSSLTYMLARFAESWDPSHGDAFFLREGRLAHDHVATTLDDACARETPVALLGASYGFVHLLDASTRAWSLPPGSVVMPTGGYKGRSRELDPDTLHATLCDRFGVTRAQIVGEYGMTELTSQAYEVAPGVFRAPPWMVVRAVDPATLEVLPAGEVGLLRVVDMTNIGSAVAIQTSDLGRRVGDGFEVHGRAPGATPRGCARAMDALLSGE